MVVSLAGLPRARLTHGFRFNTGFCGRFLGRFRETDSAGTTHLNGCKGKGKGERIEKVKVIVITIIDTHTHSFLYLVILTRHSVLKASLNPHAIQLFLCSPPPSLSLTFSLILSH